MTAKSSIAKKRRTKTWYEEGSRELRRTATKIAALREIGALNRRVDLNPPSLAVLCFGEEGDTKEGGGEEEEGCVEEDDDDDDDPLIKYP